MTTPIAANHELIATLSALLERWREHRDPSVADQLDAATERALASYKVANPKLKLPDGLRPYERSDAQRKAFTEIWLREANQADALTTGWLLSTLHKGINWKDELKERMRLLFARTPDPRIARVMATTIADRPYDLFYVRKEAVDLVQRCADVRQVVVLQRALSQPRTKTVHDRQYWAAALPPLIAELSTLGSSPSPASLEPPEVAVEPSALLASIVTDLSDDGPRLVYADWLLESSDPRGEFITLQVLQSQKKATPKQVQRAGTLLKASLGDWLGDLRLILSSPRFHRGFLQASEFAKTWAAPPEVWQRALDHEALNTVEELHQHGSNRQLYEGFLQAPAMRNLRCAEARSISTLEILAARSPRVDQLDVSLEFLLKESRRIRDYPGLRTLRITCDRELDEAAFRLVRDDLEHLMVRFGSSYRERMMLEVFRLWRKSNIQRLTLQDGKKRCAISRGPDGKLEVRAVVSSAHPRDDQIGSNHLQELLEALRTGSSLTSEEIVVSPASELSAATLYITA